MMLTTILLAFMTEWIAAIDGGLKEAKEQDVAKNVSAISLQGPRADIIIGLETIIVMMITTIQNATMMEVTVARKFT